MALEQFFGLEIRIFGLILQLSFQLIIKVTWIYLLAYNITIPVQCLTKILSNISHLAVLIRIFLCFEKVAKNFPVRYQKVTLLA